MKLREKVSKQSAGTGIYFDRIPAWKVTLEQYILFHAARDASEDKSISGCRLTERELIPMKSF